MEKSTKQLLSDFIANRCSPAELRKVQELIRAGINESDWREALEEAERNSVDDTSGLMLDEFRLLARIQQNIIKRKQKKFPFAWIAMAASLLLVVGLGWLLLPQPEFTGAEISAAKDPMPDVAGESAHRWIKLPDGSSVQLNDGTVLDYPDSFDGRATREVTLKGEAYFDIKHDPEHPFIIKTGKIKTTVLGTAFNISAYSSDVAVTVTVTRGKVKVEDENKTLAILTPDQQLSWTPKKDAAVKEKVKAADIISWTKKDLIMDDITIEEAAVLIAERYNVKIQFNNNLVRSCRFTAAFLNRNEIGQVLSVISDITGARLQLKDNIVVIDGNGC